MKCNPDRLIQETQTVLSLPNVYERLNEAVNDPRTSSRDVANIINEDTGLAARLLRITNSAFYGFPSRIDTVTRAVTLLGTRQLRDLAFATSVIRQFEGMPETMVTMESFWRHSIACGVAARILATYRREPNVERFFIAGLLHDIGRLIIFTAVPDLARQAMDEAARHDKLLYEMERKVMGFDHADVGGALLRQWKLPEHTAEAVAYHHKPWRSGDFHIDTAVIHVADLIANAMQTGSSGERFVPPLHPGAWKQLGLSEGVLSPLLSQLDRQYREAVKTILSDSMQ